MTRISKTLSVELALLTVPMLWGIGYPLIRESMAYIGPLAFLFYRFGIAFILLLIFYRNQWRGVHLRDWLKGIITGVVLFLAYAFLNWGLVYTTTSNAGFIIGLRVVIVPVIGAVLFRQIIPGRSWLGAGISLIGLIFIFFGAKATVKSINPGDMIMLFSAIFFALHVLLISRFIHIKNYVSNLIAQISVVTLFSGAAMLLLESVKLPGSLLVWQNIMITGLLSTLLAFWLQTRFQRHSTADRTGIIFSSEPLFASLFGFIYLGESLIGWQWPGAFLIILAMIVSQLPSRMRQKYLQFKWDR
ncbi:MAG: EamA family transporter [Caldithrix sp.]|nr:EamA family transporter [Caldithrix sp.]